jgi:sulfite exporter TauE/SafE
MVIKQLAKTLILLMQEGKLVMYLILGVGIRVTLVTLLAVGATSHAVEAISREEAQPAQVLGSLLVLALITFISTATELEEE